MRSLDHNVSGINDYRNLTPPVSIAIFSYLHSHLHGRLSLLLPTNRAVLPNKEPYVRYHLQLDDMANFLFQIRHVVLFQSNEHDEDSLQAMLFAHNSVHDRSGLMPQRYKLPCEMPLYLQPFVLQIVLIKKERRNLVEVKPIPFISLHCCPPKRNSNGLTPLKPSTPKQLSLKGLLKLTYQLLLKAQPQQPSEPP